MFSNRNQSHEIFMNNYRKILSKSDNKPQIKEEKK